MTVGHRPLTDAVHKKLSRVIFVVVPPPKRLIPDIFKLRDYPTFTWFSASSTVLDHGVPALCVNRTSEPVVMSK